MTAGFVTEYSEDEKWKYISGSGSILGRPELDMWAQNYLSLPAAPPWL
jgi:hypothetical protein